MLSRGQWDSLAAMQLEIEVSRLMLSYLITSPSGEGALSTDEALVILGLLSGVEP